MDVIKNGILHKREATYDGSLSLQMTQFLRGMCCILVGLHHFARVMVEVYRVSNPVYTLLAYQGGNIGVGLFFFLSGYGLYKSSLKRKLGFKEVLIKRYWKIYWPILIVNGIFILITRGISGFNFFDYFINFKSLDGVLWFVEILFGCYAIFYLCQIFKMQKKQMVTADCAIYFIYHSNRNNKAKNALALYQYSNVLFGDRIRMFS